MAAGFIKRQTFLITITLLILVSIVFYNSADWDLWARLAVGKIFFDTGSVLRHDIFAYTPTKSLWIDHEWGTGVIFYYLAHYFGDKGLLLLKFFILLSIFILMFKTNQLRSNGKDPYRPVYYVMLLSALMYAFSNTLRSQSFTYFFFALWIYLLDLVKLGNKKLIWLFPLTMLIWANVHGGFLAGLGLVAVYALGEAIQKRPYRRYLSALGLSFLVTLVNPYGINYWLFLIDAVTMPRPFVNEWNSLNLFGPLGQVFMFKVILVLTLISFIYLFARRFKTINWTEVLVLAVMLYMSIKHMRHVIFFIIAAGSYIYYYLYPAFDWMTFNLFSKFNALFPQKLRSIGKKSRDIALYSIVIFISLLVITNKPFEIKVYESQFPAKAVKFIQINHLSGNLLVLFNWGSYALWKLHPQCHITIDGRYEEVYPKDVVDDVARFHYAGANWDGLLKKYPTNIILVPVEYESYTKLLYLDNWKLVYKDSTAAVFVPTSKNRKKWLKPDSKFNPTKEKYNSQIVVPSPSSR